ncbi:MAG: hypothetical protein K9M55_02590 [Candidatus Marinimicrobia bacterium]|nr:hypothetical protein [Candidatus Neomarinimicrobiota bacterium]
MKETFKPMFVVFGMMLLSGNLSAQTPEWKTAVRNHGKITVNYCVSERQDESGLKVPVIMYSAVTIDTISMKNCIAIMKDASKYQELMDLEISKRITTISENDWVNYYYASPGWPLSDFDWVAKMTFSADTITNTAVFTSTAEPSLYKKTNVNRIAFDNETYAFKDLGNGETEVTVTIEESPAIKVPRWLMKIAIPGGAADFIRNIVNLAKEDGS